MAPLPKLVRMPPATLPGQQPAELHDDPPPVLDVVVPVHDEEAGLERCLRRLHAHLTDQLPHPFRITVAENASTDGTVAVAHRVAAELGDIDVLVLPHPGRGRALRTAWHRAAGRGRRRLHVGRGDDQLAGCRRPDEGQRRLA